MGSRNFYRALKVIYCIEKQRKGISWFTHIFLSVFFRYSNLLIKLVVSSAVFKKKQVDVLGKHRFVLFKTCLSIRYKRHTDTHAHSYRNHVRNACEIREFVKMPRRGQNLSLSECQSNEVGLDWTEIPFNFPKMQMYL